MRSFSWDTIFKFLKPNFFRVVSSFLSNEARYSLYPRIQWTFQVSFHMEIKSGHNMSDMAIP